MPTLYPLGETHTQQIGYKVTLAVTKSNEEAIIKVKINSEFCNHLKRQQKHN
jgi:hypothetical protein